MYAIGLAGGLGSTPNSAETAKVTVRFRTPHPTASKATNRQFYAAMVSSRSTPSLQQHADHRPTQRRSARNHCCAKWGHPTARRCRNRMAARSPPTPASADASAKQNGSSAQLFLQFVYRKASRNHTEPIARFHAFHHPVIPRRERKSHACSRNTQLPGTTFRYFQRFPCRLSRRSRLYTIPLPPYTPFQPV